MTKRKLIMALIGLANSILVLGSVWLGNQLNKESQEDKTRQEMIQAVVNTRISIIERFAKLVGKIPAVGDLWQKYLSECNSKKNNSNLQTCKDSFNLSEKIGEYNAEYQAIITLAQLYFGTPTTSVLNHLTQEDGPWWEKKPQQFKAVLDSMYMELKSSSPKIN